MGRIFFPLAVVYGVCNQISSYFGTQFIHWIQDNYPLRKSRQPWISDVAVTMLRPRPRIVSIRYQKSFFPQ